MGTGRERLKFFGFGIMVGALLLQLMLLADRDDQSLTQKVAKGDTIVSVYILEDMTTDQVIDYLYLSGVISDRNLFRLKLAERGETVTLASGHFTFRQGEDDDSVLEKLTKSSTP